MPAACALGVRAARLHSSHVPAASRLVVRSFTSLSTLTACSLPHRSSASLPFIPRRSFGAKPIAPRSRILPSSLVDVDWLSEHLPRVRVLDGSWHMPAEQRDPRKDFEAQRIPSAQFFDLDLISDHSTSLPHMLPAADDFAAAVGKLGIRSDDVRSPPHTTSHLTFNPSNPHTLTPFSPPVPPLQAIVVYDTKGVFSAARVWFTFRCFGARDVAVLQGGLPHWLHRQLPTESGPAPTPTRAVFLPTDRTPTLVRTYTEMLRNTSDPSPFQVLDARSRGRFSGAEPEPRPGLSSGHMPGAVNVPYGELVEKGEGGGMELKGVEGLVRVLRKAGVRLDDRNAPIVTTCGTGVTASVVALALELLGHRAYALYDGSWTEWAQQKGAPIIKDNAAAESP